MKVIAFISLMGVLAGCFSTPEAGSVSTPTLASATPLSIATRAVPTPPPQQPALKATPVPAFPMAEGAGALTPGGRGGRVIEVTTLHDDGPGSLRAAVHAKGSRIVVFRVGGIIELKRPLHIQNPYITIAGQTAPGGGITLKGTDAGGGKMIKLRDVHDVVIRYVRIRSGAHGKPGRGQINIAIDSGTHDVMIDHTSLSWTLDENISIHRNIPDGADPASWPHIYNITVQRSLIAEGLYPHSTGMQIGGEFTLEGWRGVYDLSIHHNLFASNSHRTPGIGSTGVQVINNVVYNWLPRAGETWFGSRVDWIGNYFKAGPSSTAESLLVHNAFPKRSPWKPWPAPSIYMAGNMAPPLFSNPDTSNWPMYRIHYADTPLPSEFRRTEPLPQPPIPIAIQPAYEAYDAVLADVGTNARLDCLGRWVPNVDAIDARLLLHVKNGTASKASPPAHEDQVGGYPAIDPGQPCPDTDHDGMPDAWEIALGVLNPNVANSAGNDLHPNYTNIEVYLNGRELQMRRDSANSRHR